jgi:hypothetical protein
MMKTSSSAFQHSSLTTRWVLIALTVALLLPSMGVNPAMAASESVSRSYASAITQRHEIFYNIRTSCGASWSGAGYQLYRTDMRWSRSDTQFRAQNVRGRSGIFGYDCSNNARLEGRDLRINSGNPVAYGTTYSVSHSWPYTALSGDGMFVGSWVRSDIARRQSNGSWSKHGELCTRVYVNQPNSC